MAYITHDTVKNAAGNNIVGGWSSRIASWLKELWTAPSGHLLDPYNEHLLRDVGLTPDSRSNAIDWRRAKRLSNQILATPAGNNPTFIDLYIYEHLDRGPRGF